MEDVPDMRFLLDELPHQFFTLFVIKDHDLDTARLQILLSANKGLVLANDNPLDLVQDASTGAHVARAERCVHGGSFIG